MSRQDDHILKWWEGIILSIVVYLSQRLIELKRDISRCDYVHLTPHAPCVTHAPTKGAFVSANYPKLPEHFAEHAHRTLCTAYLSKQVIDNTSLTRCGLIDHAGKSIC